MLIKNFICVVPTYNESENIAVLIPQVLEKCPGLHFLIVDDNSPDGTAAVVQNISGFGKNIFLIIRQEKKGLATAYIEGFQWCLSRQYQKIIQMDADFSHRTEDLLRLISAAKDHPIVVGSRWVPGGEIQNWSQLRLFLSQMGNLYAQWLLGSRIFDWTGGFNIWDRAVLSAYDFSDIESQGYAFQIEMKYRALRLNFSPIEVPIIFEERRAGRSKMSLAIIFEAFRKVWGFRKKYRSFFIS